MGQTSFTAPLIIYTPEAITRSLPLTNKKTTLERVRYGENRSWIFVHLHGTEPTSLDVAQETLPQTGGYLIRLQNGPHRNLEVAWGKRKWWIDPNRIYSDTGIRQNLQELNRGKFSEALVTKIKQMGELVTSLFPDTVSCLIALHNNTDGHFSIHDYMPGGKRSRDARRVFVNPEQDPDDLALTTDSLLYAHMAEACFNIIWQDSANVKRDGSLSVYAALRGKRYINIETQHGKDEQYRRMLQHLMLFLVREREPLFIPRSNQLP